MGFLHLIKIKAFDSTDALMEYFVVVYDSGTLFLSRLCWTPECFNRGHSLNRNSDLKTKLQF